MRAEIKGAIVAALLCAACSEEGLPSSPAQVADGGKAVRPGQAPAGAAALAPTIERADLAVAAPAGSGQMQLTEGKSGVLLSWIEPAAGGHRLRFSRLADAGWSEPVTVAEGNGWFVNWADVPSVFELPDGSLVAHWLVRRGNDKHAYDILLSRSSDGGATWTEPASPHKDGVAAEHGFVSMVPVGPSLAGVLWLDGREMAASKKRSTAVRWTLWPGKSDEVVIDPRACDCCQTTAVVTPDGVLAAYRDRSDDEVRDISVVRFKEGAWSAPETVGADGWKITGCPVNGPALAAAGSNVALAWFGAPSDVAHVKVRLSQDGGRTWGEPVRVDEGEPLGRVDVVAFDDGTALVSWIERRDGSSQLMLRQVAADGTAGPIFSSAEVAGSRDSGFPRMARHGKGAVLAWVGGEPAQVKTARVGLGS